jgi:mannose-6-phosphate isomerase
LSPIFGEAPGGEIIGEVWLTGEECKVANGPLSGKSLGELAQQFGQELVGATAPQPNRFPLLVKFLFPREKLSVQVHPDDEGARLVGEPCGKTECWYVLDAKPGAQVGLGLKPGTTKADFERAIQELRAEELLNWIDVRKGDMIYVDAGTVHAIGPGSVLVEAQQNSDTTYRLYDYGRPRELHIEKGMTATKLKTRAGKVRTAAKDGKWNELVCSPCFRVDKASLKKGERLTSSTESSAAHIIVGLDGGGVLEARDTSPLTFAAGESVVVPASVGEYSIQGQWTVELLRAMVPDHGVDQPETF